MYQKHFILADETEKYLWTKGVSYRATGKHDMTWKNMK